MHLLSRQWWKNRYDRARYTGELARLEQVFELAVAGATLGLLLMLIVR